MSPSVGLKRTLSEDQDLDTSKLKRSCTTDHNVLTNKAGKILCSLHLTQEYNRYLEFILWYSVRQ